MEFFSAENLQRYAETYVLPFVLNLVAALAVFIVGRLIARALTRAVVKVCERSKVDVSLGKFLSDMLYALMLALVVLASLDRIGVPTTSAVAIIGAAGLAVGFALQSSLGNFASGVMLLIFKPYRVGDVVNVAGQTGTVDAIKIFNTTLHTPDNRLIIVPNGAITSGCIENVTALATRRIDLVFGIGYGDDLRKAKEILAKLVADDPRILTEPAPQVALSELADSSVNFVVRPWVKTSDYWAVKFDLTEQVKLTFDAEGISIPFPQRDVHLHEVKAAS
jgi:small conductance mechanosensitive channel